MQQGGHSAAVAPALEAALTRRAGKSPLSHLWRFTSKYPLGAFGGIVILAMLGVALAVTIAPWMTPHDPLAQDIPNRLHAPSSQFWLGTDTFGRDAFSRIIHGARISMYVGFVSVFLGSVSGALLGVASGYVGGKFDLGVQRIVDALLGFPPLVMAMVFVVALGASLNNVTIAIAVTFIPRMIRLSRSSALSVKEEVYILASQAIGAGTLRIMVRHVLPNTLAPAFVLATGYLGTAIVSEASLSFLGLGVPPPHASWGSMLELGARGHLESAPWLAIYPGVALSLGVFAFAFFGDALRDAFDPRLRGR
jgi:peptide/nickel transport system permease protein